MPAAACCGTSTERTVCWPPTWPGRAGCAHFRFRRTWAERESIDRAVAEARTGEHGIWAVTAADVSLTVDKVREVVTLTNSGSEPLDISGWWLVSLRGKQSYRFPTQTTIAPGQDLRVVSGGTPGTHRFRKRNVWNNTSPDPAELRRTDGRIVAVWDDPASP